MGAALLLVSLLAAGLAGAATAKRRVLPEDLLRIRDVSEPCVSPDGEQVAYVVTSRDLVADRKQADVWVTSWDGARTARLTTTDDASETTPRWSPDGRWLAFLSSRGDGREEAQLWRLPMAGGEAERLTSVRGGIADFAWSPDGSRIVLAVADTDTVAVADPARAKPIVIDRYYFKEDGSGYLRHQRTHLVLFDPGTRTTAALTSGDCDDLHPAWSPDGREIAFVSKRGPEPDRTDGWEVWAVEARAGATPRAVTRFDGALDNPGGNATPAWSPDGRRIAFIRGGEPSQIYYAPTTLAVVPAAGGPVTVLTPDRWVGDFAWAPDGRSLVAVLAVPDTAALVRVPAAGGEPVRLAPGTSAEAFAISRGGRIAAVLGSADRPGEVFAIEARGARRLSRLNDALVDSLDVGRTREIRFPSRDGTEIRGFLTTPPGYRPGERCPTWLRLHGGPTSQYVPVFDHGDCTKQVMASRGYAVLTVNPRGSSGRGLAFANAIRADWGRLDTEDVLAAVDWAVGQGIADSTRLVVGGWSYGGMLTNYVIASDRRFRAAASGASISNALAGYGTDMYVREYENELGAPWAAAGTYMKISFPFLHADRITTPTLFMCGDKDFNVPLLNSEQMYQALRSLGIDTRLVIYPGQTHGLRRPSFVLDRARRYADWFDSHLAPTATPPAP